MRNLCGGGVIGVVIRNKRERERERGWLQLSWLQLSLPSSCIEVERSELADKPKTIEGDKGRRNESQKKWMLGSVSQRKERTTEKMTRTVPNPLKNSK